MTRFITVYRSGGNVDYYINVARIDFVRRTLTEVEIAVGGRLHLITATGTPAVPEGPIDDVHEDIIRQIEGRS